MSRHDRIEALLGVSSSIIVTAIPLIASCTWFRGV